ncbi:hypothetical protein LCY76_21560 [Fictibacillus sp. KIGAM418]|uniref:Uncharacterized protein n=1 Tax=Fictibacillus marinisediminis TaxID=2878389 RepID=A0A9X2BEL8_9BACL|nr:hypothetical protein [Fictibacillus marinisediminis]MCK6259164.1 hypothetical protein [Fictibacillus marinisediminis]
MKRKLRALYQSMLTGRLARCSDPQHEDAILVEDDYLDNYKTQIFSGLTNLSIYQT